MLVRRVKDADSDFTYRVTAGRRSVRIVLNADFGPAMGPTAPLVSDAAALVGLTCLVEDGHIDLDKLELREGPIRFVIRRNISVFRKGT